MRLKTGFVTIIENAEKSLEIAVRNWDRTQKLYPGNEKALSCYTKVVEINQIVVGMVNISMVLVYYLSEEREDLLKKSIFKAFDEISQIYLKGDNPNSETAREYLNKAITAFKNEDTQQAESLLTEITRMIEDLQFLIKGYVEEFMYFTGGEQAILH